MASIVFVEKPAARGLRLTNALGADVAQGEFVVMAGKALIAKEAVVSAAEGAFEDLLGAQVQAADYVTGEATFASAGLPVYWEPVTRKFSNAATSANYHVGYTLGAKVGTIIKFIAIDPRVIISDAATMAAAIAADETALSNHIGDTSDAHDASAISVADTGELITATTVEAALAEIVGAGRTTETVKANADAIAAAVNLSGKPFCKTVTLTALAAATAVHIITAAEVGAGKKAIVTGFKAVVSDATAWSGGTGTKVVLQDDNGSPVPGAEIAVAGLTGNAVIAEGDANVTLKAAIASGFTTAKGLDLKADNNFGAGSDLVVTVTGFIVTA